MPDQPDEGDLDILIQTGIRDSIGIDLAKNLLREAGIPFFAMNENNLTVRYQTANIHGFWDVRVPRRFEAEAREILHSVEGMK